MNPPEGIILRGLLFPAIDSCWGQIRIHKKLGSIRTYQGHKGKPSSEWEGINSKGGDVIRVWFPFWLQITHLECFFKNMGFWVPPLGRLEMVYFKSFSGNLKPRTLCFSILPATWRCSVNLLKMNASLRSIQTLWFQVSPQLGEAGSGCSWENPWVQVTGISNQNSLASFSYFAGLLGTRVGGCRSWVSAFPPSSESGFKPNSAFIRAFAKWWDGISLFFCWENKRRVRAQGIPAQKTKAQERRRRGPGSEVETPGFWSTSLVTMHVGAGPGPSAVYYQRWQA